MFENTSTREKILLFKLAIAGIIAVPLALIMLIGGFFADKPRPGPSVEDREQLYQQMLASARSKDAASRLDGVEQLYEYRPIRKESLEVLAARLTDENGKIRATAAEAINKMPAEFLATKPDWLAPLVEPALQAFASDDLEVMSAGAQLLIAAGPAGKDKMLPGLKKHLAPDSDRRVLAASILIRVDPAQADEALNVLASFLDSPDAPARLQAVSRLAALDKLAARFAPQLLRIATEDADPDVRVEAASALVEIAPEQAKEAAPALVELVKDIDLKTGGKVKPSTDPRTINLEALAHPLGKLRTRAMTALRQIDPKQADLLK